MLVIGDHIRDQTALIKLLEKQGLDFTTV